MKKSLLLLLLLPAVVLAQSLPQKNKTIVTFCENHKGKKIGRGECWDLAKAALDTAGAVWESPYGFGTELKKKETPLPGDIIQFENVNIEYEDGSSVSLPHHTAIIYKVSGPRKFTIADQNSNNKRYVIFTELDLSQVKKGKYMIYRPK